MSPHPLALEIRYLRDIDRDDLVDATRDQWQKMGYPDEQINSWVPELDMLLMDVQSGEKLVYVSDGRHGEMIHYSLQDNAHVLGVINDEQLNEAFLSIWLSPKTQYPKLRDQLIGMNR